MRSSTVFMVAAALAAIAPSAARGQEKPRFTTDDSGGSTGVAEARVDVGAASAPMDAGTASAPLDAGAANAPLEQESRFADRTLMQAIATNDRLTAARLLDSEFIWVDRDGRSRSKSELVDRIGLLSEGPDVNLALRAYGRVALVTGRHPLTPDGAEAFFTRVWVRRGANWRLLLYQETAPEDFSEGAREGVAAEPSPEGCDNPCASLPYKPLTDDAEEIVASFMAGEKALFDGDAEAAGRILGDDVLFITADGEQPIDKAQRVAAIRNLRRADQGDPPPAVASMAVWVFGEAAVMSADQVSRLGDRLRSARIWAKRDGQWQLIFSQQTEVQ